jgi:hypothetical protein
MRRNTKKIGQGRSSSGVPNRKVQWNHYTAMFYGLDPWFSAVGSSAVHTISLLTNSTFWDMTPCGPLEVNLRFRGMCPSACFISVSCSAYTWTLKMEATCSSKPSADFRRATWRYIPENVTLRNHRCENLKSYKPIIDFTDLLLVSLRTKLKLHT